MTTEQTRGPSEELLLDIIAAGSFLVMRVRALKAADNFFHPTVGDIEPYLIAAVAAAVAIDSDLFDDSRGCISHRLH
jgi:hypothetical protein